MRNYLLLIVFGGSLFLFGCAHTNELAKYDLSGKKIMFNESIQPKARKIEVTTAESYGKKDKNSLLSTITSIGTSILNSDSRSKLENAVDTDSLVYHVSDGMKYALETYLSIKPVKDLNENPQFIVETNLKSCKLVSSQYGVNVKVTALSRIVDRNTGKLVWENSESESVPVGAQDYSGTGSDSKSIDKVFTAVQLAALSPKEIDSKVYQAAEEVGRMMSETLRKDISESKNP